MRSKTNTPDSKWLLVSIGAFMTLAGIGALIGLKEAKEERDKRRGR